MQLSFPIAVDHYFRARSLTRGTKREYSATVKKWHSWGHSPSLQTLNRKVIREFLDWVHEDAIQKDGTNPGRTTNKAREHLRAVMSWAWEQDLIETLPRFPKPRAQRDAAGRHYLTKSEVNALYFGTYRMKRPRGWNHQFSVGRYWRAALVLFFNYGLDTGTIWKTAPEHEPILWRHVCWNQKCPDGQTKERSRWGWIFYRRVKTQKTFYRPMNRVVHAHLKHLQTEGMENDAPVILGGSSRPNLRFQQLCDLANIEPKVDIETGEQQVWSLKDLRKTCATHYDQRLPESSIEILGHSVGGITYRHYAHRDPLTF